jgi:hypothetical protein
MHNIYQIDVARRLVTLHWIDLPSIAQLKEVIDEAVADLEFRPGMSFMWDRKPAPASPASTDYLREALYYLQALAEKIGPHSWALVGHNEADFGKARMLEALSDGTKVTIRAFKCAGDAEEWLRDPIPYESHIVHLPPRSSSIMGPRFA